MGSNDSTVELKVILRDEFSNQFKKTEDQFNDFVKNFHSANDALLKDNSIYEETFKTLTKSIQENSDRLSARLDILRDPGYVESIKETALLKVEIDNLSKKILEETEGTRENIAMLKANAAAEEAAKKAAQDAAAAREASAQAWNRQVSSVTQSLANQNRALLAQQQAMKSPEYQEHLETNKRLKSEIAAMTGATVKDVAENKVANEVERGIFSNMRTRREALVMAHEAMMGRTKNLMGSAMVFAEYTNSSILETVTSMINPYTIAIAAMSAATVGLIHHYVELSEKAAETYHESGEMGERLGMTAEQMEGLDYATIGTKVKTEELARAISTFSVKLEQHRAQFAALGVTAQDPVKAFEQFIDAAGRAGTESERNRILEEGLGKTWQQVAPVILQGGKALEDAIQKGKLPPEIKKDFEDMIQYQKLTAKAEWEADRAASQHAASIALENEKMKAGLAIMREKFGLVGGTVLYGLDVATSGMSEHNTKTYAETLAEQAAAKQKALSDSSKKTTSTVKSFTEEQQKILDEANKERATKSLSLSLQLIRDEYAGKISQFKKGSEEYNRVVEAEDVALQAVRDRFAKKNHKKAGHDDTTATIKAQVAEDQRAAAEAARMLAEAQSTSTKQGGLGAQREAGHQELDRWLAEEQQKFLGHKDTLLAIQVNYRAKMKALDDQFDAKESAEQKKGDLEYLKEVQARQDARLEKMKKAFQEEEREAKDAGAKEGETFADAWMLAVDSRLQKTKPVIEQVADLMMSTMDAAISSISSGFAGMIVQGKSFRSTLASIGETIETDVISSIIKMGLQYVEETALRLTTSTAANAVTLAEGTATATALAAAWAPAATAASIASFGAADAAGISGMAAAYAAGEAYWLGSSGFAGGGVQFGSAYTGERGPEISTPTVPRRITQTTNSTVNNSYGGATVIINTGASVDRVAAVAVRATTRQARGMVRSSR